MANQPTNGESTVSDFVKQFEKLQAGIQSFADEMREKGIHVGMGREPRCVNCGEAWPCAAERKGQ